MSTDVLEVGRGWGRRRAGWPPRGPGEQPGGLQPVARAAAGRAQALGSPSCLEARPHSTLGLGRPHLGSEEGAEARADTGNWV